MPHIAWVARAAILSFALGLSMVPATATAADRFVLQGGYVMHYADAAPTRLDVGYKCTDLWVAPDGSAVAFIAMEKTKGSEDKALKYEQEPLIERSSVYIARKAAGFAPVLAFAQPITIDGRAWSVFRAPSLSSDGRHLYVGVPFTMTTWKIVDVSLSDGSYQIVANATDYCVIWNGAHWGISSFSSGICRMIQGRVSPTAVIF